MKPGILTFLCLSGYSAGSGLSRKRFEGSAHLLHKPFTVVGLLETVRQAMRAAD